MAYSSEDMFLTPKPSTMFSFTTTVAPSSAMSPSNELSGPPKRETFSSTKEILPLYFSHMERFQFEAASRVLAVAARSQEQVWVLLPHLQLLTACEAIYHSLIFLEAFSTNQYLETMYDEVRHAIERVADKWSKKRTEAQRSRPTSGLSAAVEASAQRMDAAIQYYCQLLKDLVVYLDCRSKLVNLRVTLHKKALEETGGMVKQGIATLGGILLHLPLLKHQLLAQMAQNLAVEVLLFQKLLQTELGIANYQLAQASFHFHALDVELQSCRSRFIFLQDKTESSDFLETALYHWFLSFRDSLLAKMNFLFAEFRAQYSEQHSPNNEPFAQEAGAELMMHEKIVEFAAQSGCFNVSLVLRPADGMGSGKSSWKPVYTFPQHEAPFSHWPSIISLYQDNMEQFDSPIRTSGSPTTNTEATSSLPHKNILSGSSASTSTSTSTSHPDRTLSKGLVPTLASSASSGSISSSTSSNSLDTLNIPLFILHYYDTYVDTTYYMATLQPKMLLVVIFNGERLQDDVEVNRFMKGLFAKLRYSQLLQKVLSRASSSSLIVHGTQSPTASTSRGTSPAP